MNVEHVDPKLQEDVIAAARGLPAAPDRLNSVVRRGRRRRMARRGIAVLAVVAALVVVSPLAWSAISEPDVRLVPAEPLESADSTPSQREPVTGEDATSRHVDVLGAPVLLYGEPTERDGHLVLLAEGERRQIVWPGRAEVVFPDGQGGVVLQPANSEVVLWLPNGSEVPQIPLAETDEALTLRGVLPDGRVVYSVRPEAGAVEGGDLEELFAVVPSEDPQPELLATSDASFMVGPVRAGARVVLGSCSPECVLHPLQSQGEEEPLYEGRSIGGLSATAGGGVVVFVEYPAAEDGQAAGPAELVVLDGGSFDELNRIPLPEQRRYGSDSTFLVSPSDDGQRILIGVGTGGQPVPAQTWLVEEALSAEHRVIPVEEAGVVRWAGETLPTAVPEVPDFTPYPGVEEVAEQTAPRGLHRVQRRSGDAGVEPDEASTPFETEDGAWGRVLAHLLDAQEQEEQRRLLPGLAEEGFEEAQDRLPLAELAYVQRRDDSTQLIAVDGDMFLNMVVPHAVGEEETFAWAERILTRIRQESPSRSEAAERGGT